MPSAEMILTLHGDVHMCHVYTKLIERDVGIHPNLPLIIKAR